MNAILGLSMTSTGIGWVLRDQPGVDATVPDHDALDFAFDFVPEVASDDDISLQTSAVRRAQALAASSGRQLKSIHVTWSDDVADKAPLLLKSLPDLGFDHIVPVKLKEATRTWALAFGRTLGFETCAVCLVESASVTVLTVGYGTARTAASTPMVDRADGLSTWLTEVIENNHLLSDGLFLVGTRDDLEPISTSLKARLSMPVVIPDEAQFALARGAAMAAPPSAEVMNGAASQQTNVTLGGRYQQHRLWPPTILLNQASGRPQAWAAAALAVCAVTGVIASYAFAPGYSGQSDSPPTVNRPASNSASTFDSSAPTDPSPASLEAMPPALPSPAPVVQRATDTSLAAPAYSAAVPASVNEPSPQANVPSPQVTVSYQEDVLPTAAPTTTRSIVQPAQAPVRPGDGSGPSGGTSHWPFPTSPSTGEDPPDDPIDPGDEDPGGEDPPGGGGEDPSGGGGQNPPGGSGQNPPGGDSPDGPGDGPDGSGDASNDSGG
jgi:hypothetical protein